jgi:hypothetical protein
MIITESFVWINFPKTASTFVRECLRELYTIPWWNLAKKRRFKGRWMKEIQLPNIRSKNPLRQGKPNPHGLVRQIPDEYKKLPVVSAIRPPVDWLVSLYYYGDWKKTEALPAPIEKIALKFPKFPELNLWEFGNYLESFLTNSSLTIGGSEVPVGIQSMAMIEFYSPDDYYSRGQFAFTDQSKLWDIFNKIFFVDSNYINIELHKFLLKNGYHKKDLSFLLTKGKVNFSIKTAEDLPQSFKEKINRNEWIVNHILKTKNIKMQND